MLSAGLNDPLQVEASTLSSTDDCVALALNTSPTTKQDQENLVMWMRQELGATSSGFIGQAPHSATIILNQDNEEQPRTDAFVHVDASIEVKGGVLSLIPRSRKADLLVGLGSDLMRSSPVILPFLIVSDATGLGGGWQMTVRINEDNSPSGDMYCWALMLPQEGIVRIYGNDDPESQIIDSSRLNTKDQLVVYAKPNQGMGMYLTAPYVTDAPTTYRHENDNLALLVVCLIAGP